MPLERGQEALERMSHDPGVSLKMMLEVASHRCNLVRGPPPLAVKAHEVSEYCFFAAAAQVVIRTTAGMLVSSSSCPNRPPPSRASMPRILGMPRWLAFSLLTILVWGAWGAVSKVASEGVDANTNQIFFTFGLLPLIAYRLAFAAKRGRRSGKTHRNWLGISHRHFRGNGQHCLLSRTGDGRQGLDCFAGDRVVPCWSP